MRDKSNLGGNAVALNRSEKINLVQMAMKRVNVVPYGENQIAFGTKSVKVRVLDLQDTTKKEEAKDLFEYVS
jgi:translation elongation factor EF-1beta